MLLGLGSGLLGFTFRLGRFRVLRVCAFMVLGLWVSRF